VHGKVRGTGSGYHSIHTHPGVAIVNRSIRIALVALLLVGVLAGSALAAQHPGVSKAPGNAAESEAPETPPTAAELAHAVDRLKAHDIAATSAQLSALAGKYGLGGAIRLMAWSKSTGKTVAELTAMRDAGKGWGEIGRELGVSPGIGWIMGNGHAGGNGKAGAPGQKKDHAADPNESPEASESET
jgi:hypothetical protein